MKSLYKKSKKSSVPKPVVIKPDNAETKTPADKPKTTKKSIKMRTKIIVVALVLLVAGGLHALLSNKAADNASTASHPVSGAKISSSNLKSSVSYTLPDGWGKSLCPSSTKIVYVVPSGTVLNCNAVPSSPIKIYVDTGNTTDCQQLITASIQNIKKHVCKSLYISGRKALKASTTYGAGPVYKTDTTVSDYYINTGKTVIAVEYTYMSANNFQAGFDQLATTAVIKK